MTSGWITKVMFLYDKLVFMETEDIGHVFGGTCLLNMPMQTLNKNVVL